jgi:hypothetical protein
MPWGNIEPADVKRIENENKKKGIYRATHPIKPGHWIRSEDPDHPVSASLPSSFLEACLRDGLLFLCHDLFVVPRQNMRIHVAEKDAHRANLLPENSYWKDHDSDVSFVIADC